MLEDMTGNAVDNRGGRAAVRWMLPLSANPPQAEGLGIKAWIMSVVMPPERTSPKFFDTLSFVLRFLRTDPSEVALRKKFETIGVRLGTFKPPCDVTRQDLVAGMGAGQKQIDTAKAAATRANDLFGTRESMKNNDLNRAVGAQAGILGNTAAEAVYLNYGRGRNGQALTGARK